MLCPLLYSPSSSLLSFSLILHFDIFILKKKQPKFYSNPLSLRSLFSPVFARLLFPPRSFSILFIISPHFIHFSFSSLTPSSCLTHNHSRLISITQHLSLLPFFLPEPPLLFCCLTAAVFNQGLFSPFWIFFELCW